MTAEHKAIPCPRNHKGDGSETYSAVIVRVTGKLDRRNPLATPETYHPCRWDWQARQVTFDKAQEFARDYNRKASKRGYGTWAVIYREPGVADFLGSLAVRGGKSKAGGKLSRMPS